MTSPVAYWHVPDIEAKLAEVIAAGATVKEPVRDVGAGRLVATVTDPDGNVLGLLQDRERWIRAWTPAGTETGTAGDAVQERTYESGTGDQAGTAQAAPHRGRR